MDPKQLLREGRAFCMAPWVHLHLPTDGEVTPCTEAKLPLGQIDREGFEGVWNGAPMRAFRAQLLRDEQHAGCQKCYEVEASGTLSHRQRYNAGFAEHLDRAAGTSPDGRIEETPVSWDLRFSNLCNFACRMCWHGSSSRWFEDGVALGITAGPKAVLRSCEDSGRFLEQVADQLPGLEQIYFAGGEPLVMEEHYRILEMLVARGLTGVRLVYNTNLSHLALGDSSAIDLWRSFPSVVIQASIDGVGARGELIRKGLDWNQFVANVRRVRGECPHIELGFGVTVSIFNVLHLPELHRTLMDLAGAPPDVVTIHALQDPPYYSVRNLTGELEVTARDELARHRRWVEDWYDTHQPDAGARHAVTSMIDSVAAFVAEPADPEQRHAFRRITAQLDQLRHEATHTVCPELAPLLAGGP